MRLASFVSVFVAATLSVVYFFHINYKTLVIIKKKEEILKTNSLRARKTPEASFRFFFITVEVKTGSKGKEAFQRPLRVTRAFTPTPASVTMPNDFLYQSSWYSHCQPLCSLTYSLHQSPRTGLLTHGQPLLAVTPPLLTHGQPLVATIFK